MTISAINPQTQGDDDNFNGRLFCFFVPFQIDLGNDKNHNGRFFFSFNAANKTLTSCTLLWHWKR